MTGRAVLTPLERALRDRIRAEGPLSVEAFMEACNSFYYATRDPLGASGDFTTAPEISQMFGEMLGAVLADCWLRAGRRADAVYAELGPGRGTLASDALRVLRRAGFVGAVQFVETSPVLRAQQAERVPDASWHEGLDELPPSPLLLVANEFFDALPVRQFVAGIERHVMIAGGGLAFDRDGEIVEDAPARNGAMRQLAGHLVAHGGIALVIDYGHERSGPGDTLQAMRGHQFAPVLDRPGEQDLTAHVDFEALGKAAREAGALVSGPIAQGRWLGRLGIDMRAAALAKAQPARSAEIDAARRRLCDAGQMGELFKVLAVRAPQWPQPPGFE